MQVLRIWWSAIGSSRNALASAWWAYKLCKTKQREHVLRRFEDRGADRVAHLLRV
jgi:hypothetical protein